MGSLFFSNWFDGKKNLIGFFFMSDGNERILTGARTESDKDDKNSEMNTSLQ